MDLRQLRYFVTVCEEESFSRAASRLHMTQPPLSTTVATLERELGVKLLNRVQHGVIPTEAGTLLAHRAAQILRQTDELRTHMQGLGRGSAGHITVAAAPPFAWRYIPPLLQQFSEVAPQATFTLVDPAPEIVLEEVLRRSVDVGAILAPDFGLFSRMYADTLHICPVAELATHAILPMSWENGDEPVDLLDLHELTWFLPVDNPRFPGLRRMAENLWNAHGKPLPPVQEVYTMQTAIPLIAGGLGVSMLPESVRDYQHSQVTTRPFLQEVERTVAALIWSKETTPTPLAQRFIDLVLNLRQAAQLPTTSTHGSSPLE